VPDWVVVPGGNLGNVSAFGKAFAELKQFGLIPRVPKLAVVNAAGADTFFELYESRGLRWNGGRPDAAKSDAYFRELDAAGRHADTLASAIEINHPVNLPKALRSLEWCGGVVREATDQEILDAKAQIGAGGLGCEPASAATVAGLLKLVREGVIAPSDRVACVLTGHLLKDPTATVAYHSSDPQTFADVLGKRGVRRAAFANKAVQVPNDLDEIVKAIELYA
jgi:threonine synthase